MGHYTGKKVFVSGGSSGIGRALALRLAKEGAQVCIAARGEEALEKVLGEMLELAPDESARMMYLTLDATDPAAVDHAAEVAWEHMGGLDQLICNQGFAHTGRVHEVPVEDFRRLLEVNFLGHAYLSRSFAPYFMRQGHGGILMVSSVLGYLGTYGYAPYCASKWAIVGFAEGLRQELALHGVKVQVAYPGTTETPGLQNENADKPKLVWELESSSPFNQLRSADEVARLLLKAAQGRRFENPLGWDGWFTFLASRHLPGLVRWLNDGDLRKAYAKHGAKLNGAG